MDKIRSHWWLFIHLSLVLQYKWLRVKILNNIKYDIWKTAEKDTKQFFLVNKVKGLLTTNEIPLTETLWFLVNVSNTNP